MIKHSLAIALLTATALGLTACGTVPSHDVDGPSDLKNYDRSLYERTSTANRSLYERLGGLDVIERFVDRGVERLVVNPRIAFISRTRTSTTSSSS
jgi:outer membrane lipopolysaccharide assembly protein LptE/RlpB